MYMYMCVQCTLVQLDVDDNTQEYDCDHDSSDPSVFAANFLQGKLLHFKQFIAIHISYIQM